MPSRLRDRRQRHDAYYRRAKQDDYAARSVYKLEEIDRRFRLFKRGQRVLDLGCRPGSWMQYAAGCVGERGAVVGLDRQPLDIPLPSNLRAVVGDVMEIDPALLRGDLPCFQVVLTDMAPDTSGIAFTDQVRSAALLVRALDLAEALGCPNSAFVGKVLMGEGFQEALARAKALYCSTKSVRPAATRKDSTEVYVVALGKR